MSPEFKQVTIQYRGKPRWMKEREKKGKMKITHKDSDGILRLGTAEPRAERFTDEMIAEHLAEIGTVPFHMRGDYPMPGKDPMCFSTIYERQLKSEKIITQLQSDLSSVKAECLPWLDALVDFELNGFITIEADDEGMGSLDELKALISKLEGSR